MSGSSRETLLDVLEWSGDTLDARELSRGPPRCPGPVERPYRMSGCGREALPDVREWSEGHPGCQGVVERTCRMSGSGRQALPDVWDR